MIFLICSRNSLKKIAVITFFLSTTYSFHINTGEKKNYVEQKITPCCPPARIAVPPCFICYNYYEYMNLNRNKKKSEKNIGTEKKEPRADLP